MLVVNFLKNLEIVPWCYKCTWRCCL